MSCRATRLVFEAAEQEGVSRDELVDGLGVDADYLSNVRNRVDWGTFARLLERLSERLGHDPERMRAIGDRMPGAPSFAFIQRLARLVVSQRTLLDAAHRWVSPSLFPTLLPAVEYLSPQHVRMRGEIPAHYVGSEPFFQIWIGTIRTIPTLLGLPRAEVRAEVSPHLTTLDVVLPPSPTLLDRARRMLRAARGEGEVAEILDEQRREINESFAAALRAHDLFRDLLDNLPALVAIHRGGKIIWANRALVEALGQDVSAIVGREASELFDGDTTTRLRTRDGRTLVCEVAVPRAVDFAGGPATMVVAYDVTERVLLQQRVAIAERLASLGLLGAGVAHEINNPLTYVYSNVELAKQAVAKSRWREELPQMLDTALEGLGRVRAIVRDLQTLSRPDDDRIEPTDVRAVIESTLALAVVATSRARIVRELSDVPLAAASVQRLGQVVLNLVVNATEAMSRTPEENELRLRTFVDERRRVVLEVEDNGEGIDPAVVGRIFDPFFTTKPIGRGTGLGLAICHQIVTGLGGEIGVRSEPGRGTVFRVALPAATEATTSGPPAAAAADAKRLRVLVIDDEPQVASAIATLLSEHDVTVATSAQQALRLIDDSYDVILCDLMMQDLTGMELFARIRAAHPSLEGRVVFMTGGAFTEPARELLARMPDRRLDKPFTLADLEAVVRRIGS